MVGSRICSQSEGGDEEAEQSSGVYDVTAKAKGEMERGWLLGLFLLEGELEEGKGYT